MLSSILTLPVRLGVRSAGLAVQTTQAVAERAIGLVGQFVTPTADQARRESADSARSPSRSEEDRHQGNGGPPADPRSQAAPVAEALAVEDAEPTVREPEPASAPPTSGAAPEPAAEAEPDHVSEEATVVEEVSEPGAEDGAGPEIRVAEPWEGYAELKAADVIYRVSDLDAAALAAVELYELSHRRRQTVLDAVGRALRQTQQPGQ